VVLVITGMAGRSSPSGSSIESIIVLIPRSRQNVDESFRTAALDLAARDLGGDKAAIGLYRRPCRAAKDRPVRLLMPGDYQVDLVAPDVESVVRSVVEDWAAAITAARSSCGAHLPPERTARPA
jgi:hypothetical protein